ncbi:hypothetical protein [Rhizobium sp. H4]|uniref:hypothetical protein n=1 Tax=Rhizobium sp. H4 TaxID=2035449 RepID=UPI001142915C|nr:hypothetical protein [Rhizobium sp. H4]
MLDGAIDDSTGSLLAIVNDGVTTSAVISELQSKFQLLTTAFDPAKPFQPLSRDAAVFFERFGIIRMPQTNIIRTQLLDQARQSPLISYVREERYLYSISSIEDQARQEEAGLSDSPQNTWGITAIMANSSPFSGFGIKVAVLDSGFDIAPDTQEIRHVDFAGRKIISCGFPTLAAVCKQYQVPYPGPGFWTRKLRDPIRVRRTR